MTKIKSINYENKNNEECGLFINESQFKGFQ